MPLQNFEGQTWVAFSDLCGTKAMYKEGHHKADKALGRFYQTVYDLHESSRGISALVVSDCAVFWVHAGAGITLPRRPGSNSLESLLERLKALHWQMVHENYLIRTTVAYGHFCYQQRIELRNLRKDMFVGDAYMDAYLANDRCTPGGIVILNPTEGEVVRLPRCAGQFSVFLKRVSRGKKWELVWWIQSPEDTGDAIRRRTEQRKRGRFNGLLRAYQGQGAFG